MALRLKLTIISAWNGGLCKIPSARLSNDLRHKPPGIS